MKKFSFIIKWLVFVFLILFSLLPNACNSDTPGKSVETPLKKKIKGTSPKKVSVCPLPSIHFDKGLDVFQSDYIPELAYISKVLKDDPRRMLQVVGYANLSKNGLAQTGLADRRARNIIAFLTRNYGISPAKFDVVPHRVQDLATFEGIDETDPNLEPLFGLNRKVEFKCIK